MYDYKEHDVKNKEHDARNMIKHGAPCHAINPRYIIQGSTNQRLLNFLIHLVVDAYDDTLVEIISARSRPSRAQQPTGSLLKLHIL